jgi:hypothetical protein
MLPPFDGIALQHMDVGSPETILPLRQSSQIRDSLNANIATKFSQPGEAFKPILNAAVRSCTLAPVRRRQDQLWEPAPT